MDTSELQRYLDVSIAHAVVVDVREWAPTPGILRITTVRNDLTVEVEFENAGRYATGDIEGGILKYIGSYDDLQAAVDDLSDFLAEPISKWRNFTATPYEPAIRAEPDPEANLNWFISAVRGGRIALPKHGRFEPSSGYWRQIIKYGSYEPERELREQDEYLGLDDADTAPPSDK